MRKCRCVWFAVLAMFTLASSFARADDAQSLKDFKHIRILLWALDVKTGVSRGFAEAQLRTEQTVTLEPTPGYIVKLSTEAAQKITSRFTKDLDTPTIIPLKNQQPAWIDNSAQSLVHPGLCIHYGNPADALRTITISVPVGSLDSPAVAKWMEGKVAGTRVELEELLLALARDGHIDADRLLQSYILLGSSERLAQWVALGKDKDNVLAMLGLTVAARLGDPESLDRFCEKCLKSELREQITCVEFLNKLQPSDKVLDTMLLVAALPNQLAERGSASMDARGMVFWAIPDIYPSDAALGRAKLLVDKANREKDADLAGRLKDVVSQIETRISAATQPAPAMPRRPSSRPG